MFNDNQDQYMLIYVSKLNDINIFIILFKCISNVFKDNKNQYI